MMDREYMEDVDTMTEDTGGEALNPDYDRVSGSGEMPSLEEFLGVNHSSDGLGASSDPFGMVIGDPLYSDDSMGGFPSSGDNGFAGYGAESAQDGNANADAQEAQAEDGVSFKKVMNGSFVRNWVSNNRRLVLVLFIMAILHIANRNHAESLIRDEMNLQKEVHNLRASSIDIASKLMSISKVSAVSGLVEKRKIPIRKTIVPPMQFYMDKFERADSLIKDEPEYQQGTLYDDVYEVYAK